MKKALFIGALVLTSLASCKKDYTCECTTTDSSGTFPSTTQSSTLNGKKNDVKEACENGSSSVGTLSTTCEIK